MVLARDAQPVDRQVGVCRVRVVAAGGTIGISRLHTFEPLTVSELAIRLDGPQATLDGVAGYLTGHPGVPQLEPQPEFDGRRIDDDHLRAT